MTLSLNDYVVKALKNLDNTFTPVSPVDAYEVTNLNPLTLTPFVPTPPPTTNEQQPFHVFSADLKCTPLVTFNLLTRWNKTPVEANDTPWKIVLRAWSPSDNQLVELGYCTNGGTNTPTAYQKCYVNGTLVQDQESTLAASAPPKIDANGWIDFYSDGDGGQYFRYGPGAATIVDDDTFQPFPNDPKFTELCATIEPVVAGTSLNFTTLNTSIVSLGQISNNTENGTPIVISYNQEPTASPCGLGLRTVPNTNVCMMNPVLEPNNNFGGIVNFISATMVADVS